MALKSRSVKQWKEFNFGTSYSLNETRERFRDAQNCFPNQGRLDTRYGTSRVNAISFTGTPQSVTYFKDNSSNRYYLTKVGANLLSVSPTTTHTTLKASLDAAHKHRGITLNNRHIVAIENDGLFSFNGTTFTQLGQAAPSTPTAVIAAGGSLASADYYVKITFYASSIGFESNPSEASAKCTTSGGNLSIAVTDIPATAANSLVDKVRIYLKKGTGDYFFHSEINLGDVSETITADTASAVTPPTKNSPPIAGGGKYLTTFNSSLVYCGNETYPNEAYFSEPDLPDAFDDTTTRKVVIVPGDGPLTGIATGFYGQQALDPYIVLFKKFATYVYSERDDFPRLVPLSNKTGCVSHDTIRVIDGNVYFLSADGWKVIVDGNIVQGKDRTDFTLADGDIDDIFNTKGFEYEVNDANAGNFFSGFAAGQYMTFISEGSSNDITKSYSYIAGNACFMPFKWPWNVYAACDADNIEGNDSAILATQNYLLEYTKSNDRHDISANGDSLSIPVFANISWFSSEDMDSTCSWRELIIKGVVNQQNLDIYAYLNYDDAQPNTYSVDFTDGTSFILDVSVLDVDTLGDSRKLKVSRADINRTSESIMISFRLNVVDVNIGLISAQLHYNRNGNRNL